MYLTQIVTRNIQSHKEVVIDLPPTGLVMFSGDNSNGKSVIIRVTRDIILGHISRPQTRADLVNRKSTSGEVLYVRNDGARLLVNIAREAARTFVSLTLPGQEAIVRYVSDKEYKRLIATFGWNVVEGQDISLNITEEDDALLFYKTHPKVTGQVFTSVSTDPVAENALENLQQLAKDARTCKDAANSKLRLAETAKHELKEVDLDELKSQKEKLEYYYSFFEHFYLPELPELKAVPKINFIHVEHPNIPELKAVPKVELHNVPVPNVPKIRFPKVHSICISIPDITEVAMDIATIKENRCPTCGRRLIDES